MKVQWIFGVLAVAASSCLFASPEPSFNAPPYVNPRIIEELAVWESEHVGQDQVIAVDLLGAQNSNRFFIGNEVPTAKEAQDYWQTVVKGHPPTICSNQKEQQPDGVSSLCYRYWGENKDGIIALQTTSRDTTGTGVFESVMLVKKTCDQAADGRVRQLLVKLGEYQIGDRAVINKVTLTDKQLTVNFSLAENQKSQPVVVKLVPNNRYPRCVGR